MRDYKHEEEAKQRNSVETETLPRWMHGQSWLEIMMPAGEHDV